MLLLGSRNNTAQSVAVNGTVNLGATYRKYCKKINGTSTFNFTGTNVALQQKGIYHITATLIASAPAAGVVTFQLFSNGIALPSALSSNSITTATTELRTFVLDYYVLVDGTSNLGCPITNIENLSIINTGVAATVSNVIFNVEKVL